MLPGVKTSILKVKTLDGVSSVLTFILTSCFLETYLFEILPKLGGQINIPVFCKVPDRL